MSECECDHARIPKPALLASCFHELLHGIRLRRRRAKHSQAIVQGTPAQIRPQQMLRRQSLSLQPASQSVSQPEGDRVALVLELKEGTGRRTGGEGAVGAEMAAHQIQVEGVVVRVGKRAAALQEGQLAQAHVHVHLHADHIPLTKVMP